mmetsp:Transcript_38378/g.46320  ORF Transcript_38378/g.46320 Transcript_38378/m.46320 type:complete len:213 (-) Transcript_38378:524-1162(-)
MLRNGKLTEALVSTTPTTTPTIRGWMHDILTIHTLLILVVPLFLHIGCGRTQRFVDIGISRSEHHIPQNRNTLFFFVGYTVVDTTKGKGKCSTVGGNTACSKCKLRTAFSFRRFSQQTHGQLLLLDVAPYEMSSVCSAHSNIVQLHLPIVPSIIVIPTLVLVHIKPNPNLLIQRQNIFHRIFSTTTINNNNTWFPTNPNTTLVQPKPTPCLL